MDKIKDSMWLLPFVVLLGFVLVALVSGCDKEQFVKDHPEEARVLEEVIELGEEGAEALAEHELHIPDKSLAPVFEHKYFKDLPS